jgi:hypothetical protein
MVFSPFATRCRQESISEKEKEKKETVNKSKFFCYSNSRETNKWWQQIKATFTFYFLQHKWVSLQCCLRFHCFKTGECFFAAVLNRRTIVRLLWRVLLSDMQTLLFVMIW